MNDFADLPAVDWVIDCAALPSVTAGTEQGVSARLLMDHNLLGTLNLLEYCRRHRSGLILLSTSRTYAIKPLSLLPLEQGQTRMRLCSSAQLPPGITATGICEKFSTTPPVSLYGATKLASEVMAQEYAAAYQFPLRINRCGVLAGAGQFGKADQGIFSFWINSHLRRRPLRYIGCDGTGFQVRDCLHPADLTDLIIRQINAGGDPSKPILSNVSGGLDSSRSLFELTQWCDQAFGSHPVAASNEQRPFDLPWIVLDSTVSQEAWKWRPTRTTDDILIEIADHAHQNPDWLERNQ